MEASLMAEGIGSWRNFDDIEECLMLDELMLLMDALAKSKKSTFRMLAAVQGHELNDDDDEDFTPSSNGELPEELLQAEREWKKKREEALKSGAYVENPFDDLKEALTQGGEIQSAFNLGYERK